MAKIINVKYDKELYNKLFDKKFKSGDLLGALLITNSILKLPSFDRLDLAVKRARVFYYMKEYNLAINEWFKYLALICDEKLYAKAFNGLGACFYMLGDIKLAGYYFHRQLNYDRHSFYEYSSVTAEYFEEVLSQENNYYLAYPFDKADFNKVLDKADELLKSGEASRVIETLKVVPSSSKFYSTALVTISIAKYVLGDVEGALNDIEESIKLNSEIVAICNAISMFSAVGNREKADYYLNLLNDKEIVLDEDVYKATMVYLEQGDTKKAKILAEKYLKDNKYNVTILQLLGILYYNNLNYLKAEQLFTKAYQITNSYVLYDYVKIARKHQLKKLDYTLDLQDKKRVKILKNLSELLKLESDKRLEFEDEILEIAKYSLFTNSYQVQSTIVALLGELKSEKSLDFIKKMLISVDVYDRVKAGALGFLVASGFEGMLGAVFGNIFRKIPFYKAVFDENKVFNEAYAYAFSKVAPLESDTINLKNSAENIYNTLKENGNLDKVSDVKALSATMYELSGIKKILSRREFAKFFNANLREIKKIKELVAKD